ncbi:MAG: hypothetical protein [Caudoviricetes sp.]|jgi:phage-related protein|nr:MAG: hypothetical protein [Caudoviricetes sp.]
MAALETFTWCTQLQGSGGAMTTENNDREISFSNGYSQVASSGFNSEIRSFTIVYAGKDWLTVRNFMRDHRIKPFAWKTPEGDLGLFRVKSGTIASRVISRSVNEITCTFVEQFTSVKI